MNADLLIYRYKNGSISPKDEQALLDWVRSSDDNRNYFKQFTGLINVAKSQKLKFDSKAAFDSFLSSTEEEKVRRNFNFYPLLRIAAIVILVLSMGYVASTISFTSTPKLVMIDADINQEQMLPDNSVVTLRGGGSIAYTKAFKAENREVKLDGEAFFDVERNEAKPFIVNVGEVVVEVLGTSFDVSEDKAHNSVTVTVETGKVKVTCEALNYERILLPKEQCLIQLGEDKKVEETLVEDNNHLGWLTGVLDFEETRLEEVVSVLNNVYDKEVIIGTDSIKNRKLTTKINNYPLPDVIKMLEQTLDLQIVENDQAYILIGEGESN